MVREWEGNSLRGGNEIFFKNSKRQKEEEKEHGTGKTNIKEDNRFGPQTFK